MRNLFRVFAGALLGAALAGSAVAQPATYVLQNFHNVIDNGDFSFSQRGAGPVANITTVPLYLHDRWAVVSGAATTATYSNANTGLPLPFTGAAQVQRNAAQTGVVKVCLAQEIPTNTFASLAGQAVTLSFWAKTGPNFSAAGNILTGQVTTGTVADEGLVKWVAGFTGAVANIPAGIGNAVINANFARYQMVANIPANALEGVVSLCFTPVGTAAGADYFQATGIQLEHGNVATPFEWQAPSAVVTRLQRYFFSIAESTTAATVRAQCVATTTSASNCRIVFPVVMRAVPTMSYTPGFLSSSTVASTAGFACAGLANADSVVAFSAATDGALLKCTSAALGPPAGTAGWLWDAGTGAAAGRINASADF